MLPLLIRAASRGLASGVEDWPARQNFDLPDYNIRAQNARDDIIAADKRPAASISPRERGLSAILTRRKRKLFEFDYAFGKRGRASLDA